LVLTCGRNILTPSSLYSIQWLDDNNSIESIWMEPAVAYFKELLWHYLEGVRNLMTNASG
jgi:hypothetical protein